ncbi:helix-turn-helix transcriptional regulator [Streptococcus suis]|nr:helix-turn-helix transcriptional regulator [Streptococcus suis]
MMVNVLNNLGRRIRDCRIQRRMTQQELAELANLSLPYINFIENGHRTVSLPTLIKLLEVLEISLSDFFLPFSNTSNPNLSELILEIQSNDQHEEITKNFLAIVKMLNNK